MKRWLVVSILFLIGSIASPASGDTSKDFELFAEANRNYQGGNYNKAAKGYRDLILRNEQNGHLHFNLGNTYFHQNETGNAIWHYLQAKRKIPRDEDVEANLELVLRETDDIWDGRRASPAEAVLFWLSDFTLGEHLVALLILNFAYWGLSAVCLIRKGEGWAKAKILVATVGVIALVSTGARWQLESTVQVAVVKEKSLKVVAGKAQTTKVIHKFHEGAILAVISQSGSWVEVELPSGERGWVPKSGVLL